ncbi:MAG TPA: hypothetical protein VHM70_17505 [Polyangiaceae bacterium]|nr:hypothetical protein [Polyangiaceae bacterium]
MREWMFWASGFRCLPLAGALRTRAGDLPADLELQLTRAGVRRFAGKLYGVIGEHSVQGGVELGVSADEPELRMRFESSQGWSASWCGAMDLPRGGLLPAGVGFTGAWRGPNWADSGNEALELCLRLNLRDARRLATSRGR